MFTIQDALQCALSHAAQGIMCSGCRFENQCGIHAYFRSAVREFVDRIDPEGNNVTVTFLEPLIQEGEDDRNDSTS